jgi:hypothetical protein
LEKEKKREEAAKHQQREDKFFNTIKSSMDLNENLQQLAEFIQETTKATGVYIGKLVH